MVSSKLFARKQTKAKVPIPNKNNVINTSVKKRVLRSETTIASDNESESSHVVRNSEMSCDEFKLEN